MPSLRKSVVRTSLVLLPVLVWILFAEILPGILVSPPRVPYSTTWADSLGLSYQNIDVPVSPDIHLRGWWFQAKPGTTPKGVVVGLHGHGASRIQLLELPALLGPEGYEVVLYDSRAHGQSSGKMGTFGYEEKKDLHRMLEYCAARRPELPVAAYGLSYGGAVVLQTLPDEPLLSCAIVESAFSSLQAVLQSRTRATFGFKWNWLADRITERAGMKASFPALEIHPVESARRIRQPVFLAHGTTDSFIPFEQGEEIWKSLPHNPDSEWHPLAGADHVVLFSWADESYRRDLLRFLEKNCVRGQSSN